MVVEAKNHSVDEGINWLMLSQVMHFSHYFTTNVNHTIL